MTLPYKYGTRVRLTYARPVSTGHDISVRILSSYGNVWQRQKRYSGLGDRVICYARRVRKAPHSERVYAQLRYEGPYSEHGVPWGPIW